MRASLIAVCLLLAPLAATAVTGPVDDLDAGRLAGAGAVSSAPGADHARVGEAPSDHAAAAAHALAGALAAAAEPLGIDLEDEQEKRLAPPGLLGLDHLRQRQAGNETNTTTPAGSGGNHTHYHGARGDQMLSPVWAAPFYGIPNRLVAVDVDDDGVVDTVAGTDVAVVAVDGRDGAILWARHMGSTVSALFLHDVDGDGTHEVGYSTWWQGQTARVAVVELATGAPRWEAIGPASFLSAAPVSTEPGADILAVDSRGVHTLFDAVGGEARREVDAEPLDAVGALVAGYFPLGHYLGAVADVNGDGIGDAVSVGLYYYYAFVPAPFAPWTFNTFSVVWALDGSTGELLWLHNVGGDPTNAFSSHFVLDVAALDARGDGSLDVAFTAFSLRYYDVEAAYLPVVDSYFQVIDGDSTLFGVPVGGRHAPSVLVAPILYLYIAGTDSDGDGMDEVAVSVYSLVDSLIGPGAYALERYALLPSLTSEPVATLIGEVPVGFGEGPLSLRTIDIDGDGGRDHLLTRVTGTDGHVTVVAQEGDVRIDDHETPGDVVLAAANLATGFALASVRGVSLTDALDSDPTALARFRGTPVQMEVADRDGDGTLDLYVLATDGDIHVVDGLTGGILEDIDHPFYVLDAALSRPEPGLAPDIITYSIEDTPEGLAGRLASWPPDATAARWNATIDPYDLPVPAGLLWFDGDADGAMDVLVGYDWIDEELTAIDGLTGAVKWKAQLVLPDDFYFPFWSGGRTATLSGAGDDIVLVDRSEGLVAVGGETGATLWAHVMDSYMYRFCLVAADANGDGTDAVYVAFDAFPDPGAVRVTSSGTASAVTGLVPPTDFMLKCEMQPVPSTGRIGEDLFVAFAYYDEAERRSGVGHYTLSAGADYVWSSFDARPGEDFTAIGLLGASPLAIDGGRYFYRFQDHVYVGRWSGGDVLGEFTVNGPFVRGGQVIDLDGVPPPELAAVTSDGFVWALAEGAAEVARTLQAEAASQSKPVPEGVGGVPVPLDDARNDASAAGVAAALVVLAALGAVRRRAP